MQGKLEHTTLGTVVVSIRRNSNRISASWKNGLVNLNVPAGTGMEDVNRLLDQWAPKLLSNRPAMAYSDGQRITVPGAEFLITRQSLHPRQITATAKLPVSTICVGSDIDLNDDNATRMISDMLCKIARHIAPEVLLPKARELAERAGRRPVGWTISTGHRILGKCTESGVISLSYVLVFLPEELREYVIMHEIAHLSEMNHSPRFHALLNSYLGGRESELRQKLRAHTWPVYRK